MKVYLLRITVLLITFALGVAMVMAERYVRKGGVQRADFSNQKLFILVVIKRVNSSELRNACH
jgi:hypothetical protein